MEFKHLALTGIPGIGKSTYVRTLVQNLSQKNIACIGFITEEVKENGSRIGFDIVTLDGRRGVLSRKDVPPVNTKASRKTNYVGQYAVDVESFERLVLPLFEDEMPKDGFLVIDEIGKMEMCSAKFVKTMKEFLSSPKCRMLVTMSAPKGRPFPIVKDIRNHKDFRVFWVTELIRNDTSQFEELITYLTSNV